VSPAATVNEWAVSLLTTVALSDDTGIVTVTGVGTPFLARVIVTAVEAAAEVIVPAAKSEVNVQEAGIGVATMLA
jgi:hypothetical protein